MSAPTNLFVDRRWDGNFQTLQRLIRNDALGELTEAEIHYDFENPSWLQTLSEKEYAPRVGFMYGLSISPGLERPGINLTRR